MAFQRGGVGNGRFGKRELGNVVALDGVHSTQSKRVTFSAVSQIDAYWEGLRKGRTMPRRAEVDPRGMEGALEYALLMELVAPGVARIRVSGMHLSDLLGMEVRGMPLTAFFEPADRARLSGLLDEVAEGPKVAEVMLQSAGGIGRPPLQAKLYLAPLAAERDGRPRLLAALQAKGGIGRTPRRFQIADVHKRRIIASASEAAPVTPIPAFADPAMPFEPAPTVATPVERPYLRLVKTDD